MARPIASAGSMVLSVVPIAICRDADSYSLYHHIHILYICTYLYAYIHICMYVRTNIHTYAHIRTNAVCFRRCGHKYELALNYIIWNMTFKEAYLFGSGPDSVVGIATGYGLEGPGIESRRGARFFCTRPDRPWGPPSLLVLSRG